MAAAGLVLGRRSNASSPNWRRMFFSASVREKRSRPPCSTRQENVSRRAATSVGSAAAPSFKTASAGEKRPSSLTTCSTRSGPEKAVRWVLPVEMSQKAAPAFWLSM